MKTLLICIVIAALCGGIGVFIGHHMAAAPAGPAEAADADTTQPSTEPAEPEPVAAVSTVAIRSGQVTHMILAYGTVVAQPGNSHVYSVPYECRVRRIPVAAGEQIADKALLIELDPSPDAREQLMEAQATLEAAKKDLAQTQQRFDARLATNADLLQSQQSLALADLHVRDMTQRGVGSSDKISLFAGGSGIVSKIDAQEGQIVAAGQPLVETAAQKQIEVQLGVEPAEIDQIKEGQDARLFPVGDVDSTGIAATIRLITHRVDPDTRLVDVFVTPSDSSLMLNGFVRAEMTRTSETGLIVPRAAVLPDDEGIVLFTVKNGKAVKHIVTIAAENNGESLITGDGLSAGDPVVVTGNYELEDGMAVAVQPAATGTPAPPAATEPAQ